MVNKSNEGINGIYMQRQECKAEYVYKGLLGYEDEKKRKLPRTLKSTYICESTITNRPQKTPCLVRLVRYLSGLSRSHVFWLFEAALIKVAIPWMADHLNLDSAAK